ncbi:MAG: hypothetical protein INR62_07580 [Rhodospirillales bacterium]|nr:hypothetical protein [Acetobacter sp.]
MHLKFRPVQIAVGEEGSGLLVFNGEWLIAVLVQLSDSHGDQAGHWFLETGYGRFSEGEQPVFVDRAEAAAWFRSSLADRHMNDPWMN